MKRLGWIAALGIAGAGAAAVFVYSGMFNVSAQARHEPVLEKLIGIARDRSIRVHAAEVTVPPSLGDKALIVQGVSHYRAHCAVCHGAPGVEADDMAQGMYPVPPDLQKAATGRTPAELFWVVKNGIKMSGMPSWADHGDEELWPVVAFLETLPSLTPEDYAELVAEADQLAGGRHMYHDGAMMSGDMPASTPSSEHEGHHHHDHHH